jgi:hypothetical protein
MGRKARRFRVATALCCRAADGFAKTGWLRKDDHRLRPSRVGRRHHAAARHVYRNSERVSTAFGADSRAAVEFSNAAFFVHGLGERARPRVLSGAPRARLVEEATGLRPHFFQLSPRGRVLVHPGAGAVPEAVALPRHFLRRSRLDSCSGTRNEFRRRLAWPRSLQSNFQMPRFPSWAGSFDFPAHQNG